MSQKIQDDEGNEIEVYTQAELEQQKNDAITALKLEHDGVIKGKDTEIGDLKKVSAEKTENFKKYNEMSKEEQAKYDANTVELLKRNDKNEIEMADLRKRLEERDTRDSQNAKNTALGAIHGGKEDVKKLLEEKYALLAAMPETSPEDVKARAEAAAKLAGISVDSVNPLYQRFDGEAPKIKDQKDYLDTPEGKSAADIVRQALNIKEQK